MCLAIPMKVIKTEGNIATVEADGLNRNINLGLLDNVNIDDYVIVHAGFAIQKIDEKSAKETISIIKEMKSL